MAEAGASFHMFQSFLSEPCNLTGKGTSTEVRKRSLKIPSLEHWLLEWDCICWTYPRGMVAACRKEKSLIFCPQLGWKAFRGVEAVAGSHYPPHFVLPTWKELWLAGTDLPQVSLCVSGGECFRGRGQDRVLLHTKAAVLELLSCTLSSNSEGWSTRSEFLHCKDAKRNGGGHHAPSRGCP